MLAITFWPSRDELAELDLKVKELAILFRDNVPEPLWKAFEVVNQRWPGFRLIRYLDALVSRVRKLLGEAGESDLAGARREARGSSQRALEAKRFLADLQKIQKEPKTAAKIEWPCYEHLLFRPGENRRVQLWCGDSPASPRVICYARALEMIVDDEHHEPMRKNARPLLEWIARVGNPAYSDLLAGNDFVKWMAERYAQQAAEERAGRKRKQGRERQRRFRVRKIAR
jgi:hypothetical protein